MPDGKQIIGTGDTPYIADVTSDNKLKTEATYVPEQHDTYKGGEINATTSEQELDLGSTFSSFALSNSTGATIGIRLNLDSNDQIIIEKQGDFNHSNFDVSKIFYQVTGNGTTSDITYLVTKKT